ncbi:MAG: hypothetical protein JXB04_02045, partial [Kiritimatiellae bacterium]|nr:hypothetical protein [Kiritimatiellia bacterium]
MMKRYLSLFLCLALLGALAATASARPAKDVTALNSFKALTEQPWPAVQGASTREDTLFLFASSGDGAWGSPGTSERGWSFDHNGGPAAGGWTTVDLTDVGGPFWHLAETSIVTGHGTDMSGATPFTPGDEINDFALWCGRLNVCGWISPSGYGNNWDQRIMIAIPTFDDSLEVGIAYMGDFEGDTFDYFTVNLMVDGVLTELYSNDTAGEQTLTDLHVVAYADDYAGSTIGDLVLQFFADGGYSDEDGLFISDIGAVWLDNLDILADGVSVIRTDFEDGIVPASLSFLAVGAAGDFAALYSNLFAEDICTINNTYAWAFFDLGTVNPEYPVPVVAYGPPYVKNAIQSPLLDREHTLGDPVGATFTMDAESQVWLDYQVYMDLPLNALVFSTWYVAAMTDDQPCLHLWVNDFTSWYGDQKQWWHDIVDITQYITDSAEGSNITGFVVQLACVDRCDWWCDTYGDGTGHAPPPYFDNAMVYKTRGSGAAWIINDVRSNFQDSFAQEISGYVRMDPGNNVEPNAHPVVIHGDSLALQLNMDLVGGLGSVFNADAGEERPELYLWWRVTDGPHAGTIEAAMGDPDGSDGIYSPYVGTDEFGGYTWGVMQADTSCWQGTIDNRFFSFDFNDAYFEPGDRILYFYRGESATGVVSTKPDLAMSSVPEDRGYYVVRCLPTSGRTMLFVEQDNNGARRWWQEAFTYNGYANYDIFTVLSADAGMGNNLGGQAVIGQLDQYDVIVWDADNLPEYTICNAPPEDKAPDTPLLEDFLANQDHNTFLWVMGDLVAVDLTNGESFLSQQLGANLLSEDLYYDDYTGILVPTVFATHPALEYLGGDPSFQLNTGCPFLQDLSMITPMGTFAETSHEWEEDAGTGCVAGIFNSDPDGNGTNESSGGYTNRVLFNPFGYKHALDTGYGMPAGVDYVRKMVGDVLLNLFSYLNDQTPDDVGDTPAF